MRWDYLRPAGKLFISDGKTVYLYSAAENRVEKMPLRETDDMRAPLAFLLGRLDMKKEFQDFTARPERWRSWLTARSKNDRTPYDKIEMLVAPDGEVKGLKVAGRDQSLHDVRIQGRTAQSSRLAMAFSISPSRAGRKSSILSIGAGRRSNGHGRISAALCRPARPMTNWSPKPPPSATPVNAWRNKVIRFIRYAPKIWVRAWGPIAAARKT